jgi:hypothetical protein
MGFPFVAGTVEAMPIEDDKAGASRPLRRRTGSIGLASIVKPVARWLPARCSRLSNMPATGTTRWPPRWFRSWRSMAPAAPVPRPIIAGSLLAGLAGFGALDDFVRLRLLELHIEDFVGLALSSSHAAGLVERSGNSGARDRLRVLAAPRYIDENHVAFGYRFTCLTVRRDP